MAPHNDLARFHKLLSTNPRILLVCGAGLSASSGLPTFRGAGGLWRNHSAMALATPEAFERDPGLVWLFYGYRRHMSMRAVPNKAHRALAALGEKYENVFCVSQNVDNLLEKANYPSSKLRKIHGCLFGLKCTTDTCTWRSSNHTSDPLWPILAPASKEDVDPTKTLPLLDPNNPAPEIPHSSIPRCPECGDETDALQRPDIVWFGEFMDDRNIDDIQAWMDGGVDVVLSIGTSEQVSTAVGFLSDARGSGAVYVNVNLDAEMPWKLDELDEGDFAFGGDAAEILPRLFEPIIGEL
ncbi:hypothetical protein jhhlp_000214 [Lomentospora prolificans]|uniref:Deacetylase sirtuin-type domain-containing protein n=1 Tax=Lomentospora prolificans TaxID=41688 RepID=A0A2N3NKB3_9PEZI|nr:hypothetical protein jhhlp_000214 [Lomentospora prolificans]